MAIIREDKHFTALYKEYGLQAWGRFAEYQTTDNTIETVITALVITKANSQNEIVYKINLYNNFVFYDSNVFSNISDKIDDILFYLANTTNEAYWINMTLNRVIAQNSITGFRLAVKNLRDKVKDIKETEELNIIKKENEQLENELITKCNKLKLKCTIEINNEWYILNFNNKNNMSKVSNKFMNELIEDKELYNRHKHEFIILKSYENRFYIKDHNANLKDALKYLNSIEAVA